MVLIKRKGIKLLGLSQYHIIYYRNIFLVILYVAAGIYADLTLVCAIVADASQIINICYTLVDLRSGRISFPPILIGIVLYVVRLLVGIESRIQTITTTFALVVTVLQLLCFLYRLFVPVLAVQPSSQGFVDLETGFLEGVPLHDFLWHEIVDVRPGAQRAGDLGKEFPPYELEVAKSAPCYMAQEQKPMLKRTKTN